jgi:hypothetical protein
MFRRTMLSRTILAIAALLLTAVAYHRLSAHSIDFLNMAASFSPAATVAGGSQNYTVTSDVTGGGTITFTLQTKVTTNGQTATYPRSVNVVAATTVKPSGASDVGVSGLASHIFTSKDSTFSDSVTLTAPTTPGVYQVKITADDAGCPSPPAGCSELAAGNMKVNFTVSAAVPCTPTATVLNVGDMCVLLHQTTPVDLTATLTANGNPVAGQTVNFSVDGTSVGTALTDANGIATLENYDVSGLAVGDHDVTATFTPPVDDCDYLGTGATGNLGVEYLFLGFQQPINADGTSTFGGRTIPVKIKIADGNGQPVTDAAPLVFFAFGTPAIIGTEAEPVANTNGDAGNLMRYVPADDQYIFNWDIAGQANGTHTIRIGLDEGQCGDDHTVVVSLKKKGSK